MAFGWLSDEELKRRVAELADRAHDANGQNYAARARDWQVAHDELVARRRSV